MELESAESTELTIETENNKCAYNNEKVTVTLTSVLDEIYL